MAVKPQRRNPTAPSESIPLEPMDRAAIEQRIRRLLATIAPERGIVTAYLFGSVARGTARAGSDVDLAVLFATDPPRTLAGLHLDLQADLEDELGLPVQLVVLNRADADLVHQILTDSRLVLDRDPAVRIEFEVARRREYFDLKPILDRYRHPERSS